MLQILLLVSLALNVTFLVAVWRRTGSAVSEHVHTWTPWTEFRTMEPPRFSYPGSVVFRRVRYCTACASGEKQEVGEHNCEAITKGRPCPHKENYTAIFDPLYDLKQLEREIRRLDGDL